MALDLGELNFENIGTWPNPAKMLAVAILFVAVAVVGYMLDISSKQDELSQAITNNEQLQKKFISKYKLAANLEEYQAQIKTIKEYFGAMLRQLPESTEVPGLIEDISHVALANGLVIHSIKLKDETRKEFYTELPIEIVVAGGYHNLGQFVSDVSALPRIVTLHNFEIVPEKDVIDGTMLQMQVLANTYRYTADSENDAADANKNANTNKAGAGKNSGAPKGKQDAKE